MKVNEIKKVVCVEYIADDGKKFEEQKDCESYEKSKAFQKSMQLKRIAVTNDYDFRHGFSEDDDIEIFDIQTQEDLDNLREYLHATLIMEGVGNEIADRQFTEEYDNEIHFKFDDLTFGHEICIYWYERRNFWTYGDGSVEGYITWLCNRMNSVISKGMEADKNVED